LLSAAAEYKSWSPHPALLQLRKLLTGWRRQPQQKHANRQEAARETLTLDPDGAEIALLAVRFYFDGTRAGREGVRQTKDYLRKVGADYGPDVFRGKIVSFVITPGQINYDGGRGFALY
jgi:hypothetical protein